MRTIVTRVALAVGLVISAASANAQQIADGPSIGGIGSFYDTRTGYQWIDFAPYYGMTFAQQVAALPTGFVAATYAQVVDLTTNSMPNPAANYPSYKSIVGAENTFNRDLIWGFYDTGATWYWAFDYDNNWNNDGSSTSSYADLGIWAVNTDANIETTPEPASIALLATGLLGIGGVARRRRNGR